MWLESWTNAAVIGLETEFDSLHRDKRSHVNTGELFVALRHCVRRDLMRGIRHRLFPGAVQEEVSDQDAMLVQDRSKH